ncbi:MAG TPA: hypothetical protein PLO62_12805 [Candidatus Hydrogenedentes bacterium]|nr:hypothetical protein [Candidatus Hydrogenedentota bacterium]HOS03983.1 hypothetical protein [Candidatus Hydrogenedentota bacterium]
MTRPASRRMECSLGKQALAAALCALSAIAFVAGCSAPTQADPNVPLPQTVSFLKRQADTLARKEMAAINAAQEIYKTHAMHHNHKWHPLGLKMGMYIKMYREITGYEIVDIERSTSLLRPYTFTIRYDYNWMATPQRHSQSPDSAELAKKDTEFSIFKTNSFTYVYSIDADGKPLHAINGALPVRNYWSLEQDVPPDAYPTFIE